MLEHSFLILTDTTGTQAVSLKTVLIIAVHGLAPWKITQPYYQVIALEREKEQKEKMIIKGSYKYRRKQ